MLIALLRHLPGKVKVVFSYDAKILPNSGCPVPENRNQLFRGDFSLVEKPDDFHNIRAEDMIDPTLRKPSFPDDSLEDAHEFLQFLVPLVDLHLIGLAVIRAVSH